MLLFDVLIALLFARLLVKHLLERLSHYIASFSIEPICVIYDSRPFSILSTVPNQGCVAVSCVAHSQNEKCDLTNYEAISTSERKSLLSEWLN